MKDSADQTIQLPNSLTIEDARRFHASLNANISKAQRIHLNAGTLDRIDTAGLQLLLALRCHCDESGIHMDWAEPSAHLVETARLAGLIQSLGLAPTPTPMPTPGQA
ncbi:MAG: STAS domain-containing protein [Gammaproteobacteria bacterium]